MSQRDATLRHHMHKRRDVVDEEDARQRGDLPEGRHLHAPRHLVHRQLVRQNRRRAVLEHRRHHFQVVILRRHYASARSPRSLQLSATMSWPSSGFAMPGIGSPKLSLSFTAGIQVLFDVVRDVEFADHLRVERVDVVAVAIGRVAYGDVEIAGHFVHFQNAPHHASLTAHTRLFHFVGVLAALRRVFRDEPRIPTTTLVRRKQVITRVAADVRERSSKTAATCRIDVFLC